MKAAGWRTDLRLSCGSNAVDPNSALASTYCTWSFHPLYLYLSLSNDGSIFHNSHPNCSSSNVVEMEKRECTESLDLANRLQSLPKCELYRVEAPMSMHNQ
jgi:hypothetical protein